MSSHLSLILKQVFLVGEFRGINQGIKHFFQFLVPLWSSFNYTINVMSFRQFHSDEKEEHF